jgi:predicted dienelactone hydrolase
VTAGASGIAAAAGSGGAPSAGTQATGAGASGTASAAGSGGAAVPATGGFPRTDEINVKAKGPYKVKLYTDGLKAGEYSSAVMYYPEDALPPFAAVALAPGYTAAGTDYEFVGDMLASHGIAALLTTPTDTNADQPPARGDDLVAAVKHLIEENTRQGSPLLGKLATDRICVTGHSMGGGGSLFAANKLGDMIRCVVPMQPWQPGGSFPNITAPILIVGAASDTVAGVSSHAAPHYESIPASTEKFLVVFEGDHYLSTDRTSGAPLGTPATATESYDVQAAYMVPFYKLFLESDERYRPHLYGAMRSMMSVTRYEHSKM